MYKIVEYCNWAIKTKLHANYNYQINETIWNSFEMNERRAKPHLSIWREWPLLISYLTRARYSYHCYHIRWSLMSCTLFLLLPPYSIIYHPRFRFRRNSQSLVGYQFVAKCLCMAYLRKFWFIDKVHSGCFFSVEGIIFSASMGPRTWWFPVRTF